ncbi:hypothetical protein [Nisaea nitritireducens]|uniref:hypothetical protein n=1 Tax=Nisaea nitritireducens TaxID=568392 RepID=UPI001868349C|nr:hypothetical protein [Nisaea nitritireducens]
MTMEQNQTPAQAQPEPQVQDEIQTDTERDTQTEVRNEEANRPSHLAFQVSDGQDGKSYFNRIGAAFEHRDNEGYNIALDAVPVDGKITLRTLKDRVEQTRDAQATDRGKERGEVER